MTAPLYIALIHHPVFNARGEVVCTSITPVDLHDLARTAKTDGITKCLGVCPVQSQRRLAQRIMDHWLTGIGAELNWTRKAAFERVALVESLQEARLTIENDLGKPPRLVATSAKGGPGRTGFAELRGLLARAEAPHLFLFGTGWGMTDEVLAQADIFLEPIEGGGDGSYNHLPVRAAVAIILDRLLSR
ncbi:MAG: RNA methyltransferase [Candidatus Binatia bacterium]